MLVFTVSELRFLDVRIFTAQEEAEKSLPKEEKQKGTGYRSPYDYLH